MRRAVFLLLIVVVLIAGGFLSVMIQQKGAEAVPGIWIQTYNPEASAASVTPTKGALFFLFAGGVLTAVVVGGGLLALAFWFFNTGAQEAKKMPNQGFDLTSLNPALPNSLGAVLTRRPAVTAGIVVLVLVLASIAVALLAGVFLPK